MYKRQGYTIIYGISNNDRKNVDNSDASHIGYMPEDNAEVFAEEPLIKSKYKNGLQGIDLKIDINNWKNSESPWTKRYKIAFDDSRAK